AGAGLPDPIMLTQNHRNSEEIAFVAEHFHRSGVLPPGLIRRGRRGEKPQLIRANAWDDIAERVATRFRNRGGTIGVVVFRRPDARLLHQKILRALTPEVRVDLYLSEMDS